MNPPVPFWRESPEAVALAVLLLFAGWILPDSHPLALDFTGVPALDVRAHVRQQFRVLESRLLSAFDCADVRSSLPGF